MINLFLPILFSILIAVSSPAQAQTSAVSTLCGKEASNDECLLISAREAMLKGDYTYARFIWESKKLKGNPFAQHGLGVLYLDGMGVSRDINKSIELFEQSANSETQISSASEYLLGHIYSGQSGAVPNMDKSLYWYERSASNSFVSAQTVLAAIYMDRDKAYTNYPRAYMWAEKSAHSGDPIGQLLLSDLYGRGLGTSKNYTQAYFWLLIASNSNDEFVAKKASVIRDKLELILPNEDIIRIQRRATVWMRGAEKIETEDSAFSVMPKVDDSTRK